MEKALERPEGECLTLAEAAASWAPGTEVGRPCCLFRGGDGGGVVIGGYSVKYIPQQGPHTNQYPD